MRLALVVLLALGCAGAWLEDARGRLQSYCWRQRVFTKPIQYSIPTRKWQAYSALRDSAQRQLDFAPLIPGDPTTYRFPEERSYLEMYSSSFFCITKKKGGWDCLRHYEILLAGCMPYFLDLDFLPSTTMVNFPRHLIKALMHLPGIPSESTVVQALQNGSASQSLRIDHHLFPRATFEHLRQMVLQYVQEFMLSSHRAADLQIDTPQVLIQSKSTLQKPVDYLRELLVVGLLELGFEVFVTCNVDYIFEGFDVHRQGETWKTSYGRGFLYERALPAELKQKLHFATDEAAEAVLLRRDVTYVKTTYNNQAFPRDLRGRGPDLLVDGNDIWAPHLGAPEGVPGPSGFQRELTACHELQYPAQVVMGTLESGDLWACDQHPGGPACSNLHEAATLWYEGLTVLPQLKAHKTWRNEVRRERILGDIEDYWRTPSAHPDFVEKYQAIAANSRQFLDAYRSMIIRTDRAVATLVGPRILQGLADPLGLAQQLATCGEAAQGTKFRVEDPCHWGFPRHGILAVLHVLNGPASDATRGCLLYGFAAAGIQPPQELWANAPALMAALPSFQRLFLQVLLPKAANAKPLGPEAHDLGKLHESWGQLDALLSSLDISDWELKAWLHETAIMDRPPPQLRQRMAQRSEEMRKNRRGLLEQVASLR